MCVASKTLPDVPKETGYPDIVIEATGVSRVVFDAMEILGPNGVLCLLSVTGGDTINAEPIDLINQRLVLGNQVVFGSVNANPRHFKQGVKEIAAQQGRSVSFMPKPSMTEPGSSCHIHASLWQNGKNVFWDVRQKAGSKTFRQFLGGFFSAFPAGDEISVALALGHHGHGKLLCAGGCFVRALIGFAATGGSQEQEQSKNIRGADG